MALHDLTPQLRTRLSRVERAVGWFVLLATALLVIGFAYYVYSTAQRKGWFIQKVAYQTSLNNASGLKVGDPVMLMGFTVGEITRIDANKPYDYYGVTISFVVKKPYFGYLWSDSTVKVAGADLLGKRTFEVTKGIQGLPTVEETTNKVAVGMLKLKLGQVEDQISALQKQGLTPKEAFRALNMSALTNRPAFYSALKSESSYWLQPAESPAVTERLEKLVGEVELALPNFLALTNQLLAVLTNGINLTSNLNIVAVEARPAASNLTALSAELRGPGALGAWALGTNAARTVGEVLENANTAVVQVNTNLAVLMESLARSLDNLAGLTSNLNAQVESNTNILSEISAAVIHTDELVQGLKRHWLLRSAFRTKATNAPAKK